MYQTPGRQSFIFYGTVQAFFRTSGEGPWAALLTFSPEAVIVPHPFDATLKDILGHHAADLAPVLQLPLHLPWRPLNVDLSTISAATDLVFGFGEPLEQIVDIDFQSGPDSGLPGRLLLYNATYHHH